MLEIGTGSGFQSALLTYLTPHVHSIEIIPELAGRTRGVYDRLIGAGYREYAAIATRSGDGYYGWEEAAPFDKIIVTCGIDHIPPPLLQQLKPSGIMVIPVGPPGRAAYPESGQEGRRGRRAFGRALRYFRRQGHSLRAAVWRPPERGLSGRPLRSFKRDAIRAPQEDVSRLAASGPQGKGVSMRKMLSLFVTVGILSAATVSLAAEGDPRGRPEK